MRASRTGPAPTRKTDVLIVGGGASGLYAGFLLKQAGLPYLILEAGLRVGGRVSSRPEMHSHLGLVLDEGANLVNSTDSIAIGLLDRFDIGYVRRLRPGADSMHYLTMGRAFSQAEFDALVFAESREALARMMADQALWRADPGREFNARFIGEDIASYLRRCGAGPLLTTMLKAFFWSEYGRELENLNLHVLFDYLALELDCPCFKLIPNADEAFTVPGGLAQVTDALARENAGHILTGRRVRRIMESGGAVLVEAVTPGGQVETHAAHNIAFAAPLHSLASIEVMVDGLAQRVLEEARRATYARGSKLHLKFARGFAQAYPFTGILLTDTGEQIWTSGTGQGGAGLLTVLTGPLPAGDAATLERAGRVLQALEHIHPGLTKLYVEAERSDAPMSYSGALRPGEAAGLAITKGAAHWLTIGEAAGHELRGYLEGAFRSADAAIRHHILARHSKKASRVAAGPDGA